jgi:hypothetical protein
MVTVEYYFSLELIFVDTIFRHKVPSAFRSETKEMGKISQSNLTPHFDNKEITGIS